MRVLLLDSLRAADDLHAPIILPPPFRTCYYTGMRIMSCNVNGIRAVHKKDVFLPFIKKYKPDILCLQETKAEQHQSPIDLPDYEEFWSSSKGRKGYSGTAIFTKRTPEDVIFGMPEDIAKKYGLADDSYGDPNEEGRIIAADIGPFYVVSV